MAPGFKQFTLIEAESYRTRQAKALHYAREGHAWEEVARLSGFNSRQAAHRAVKAALDDIIREPAKQFIAAKLAEIEILKAKWWPCAGPDLKIEDGVVELGDAGLKAFLALFDRECALRGIETRSPKINVSFFPTPKPEVPALPEIPDDPERQAAIAFHVRELRALYAGRSTGLVGSGEPGGGGAVGDSASTEASGLLR
jgi:hypothetical protein